MELFCCGGHSRALARDGADGADDSIVACGGVVVCEEDDVEEDFACFE